MFQVKINKKYTVLKGTDEELLKGLILYVKALKGVKIPDEMIIKYFEHALGNETITEDLKIKRVDLSNLTEKEVKDVFENIVGDLLNNRRKSR